MQRTVPVESTADAYLELLAARGIDYLFGNGGTDFGPIVDAYARRLATEAPVPKPVTVPHEIVAVAMAHGYTVVTGRPQAVMVHTIAGTANATGGIINAARAQTPMLFTAGRTPITDGPLRGSRDGGIHWAQESFDQGSMVREWVKWDYELRFGNDLEGVVDRALAICDTEPKGPVYLTLPREVLAHEIESFLYDERPRMTPNQTAPAPANVQEAARLLARAKNPIAITRFLGKDAAAPAELVRLCETLGLPLFDFGQATHVNFPHTHPLHLERDPGPQLPEADVVLVIECDVPWTPKRNGPNADATVIALGSDPLYARLPMRGFAAHLTLAGTPSLALAALADAVKAEGPDAAAVQARTARWSAEHDKVRAEIRARAEAGRAKTPLDKAYVSACLEELRTDDFIILSELGLDMTQFVYDRPGQFYGVSAAGVLGWGLGAGLGAKLAAPDKTVVACVGDGSYMFGAPTAAHWVARRQGLPVLFIVWNNSQWGAVAGSTRGVYPDGWAVKTNNFPFSDLSENLAFEQICAAAGGYGERVEDPAEVPAALKRALHAVQVEGRHALLNMIGAGR